MKLLVLYEELAGYFLACVREFAERYNGEVLIFHKEMNAVAPFSLESSSRVTLKDRSTVSVKELEQIAFSFAPDAVLCGGWVHKPHLAICKHFHPSIPVVLGFDNWWRGDLKQRISCMIARVYFSRYFSHCFVPGEPQKKFAFHLGFPPARVRTGAYSCDFELFHSYYEKTSGDKKNGLPKRFVFAGRYSSEKGIEELWNAFINLHKTTLKDWELWCLGKGNIEPVQHPAIRHFGFVQPGKEMEEIMQQCGVFILPSRVEPWGVVVHEFAAAGFPLLLSNEVGAAEAFLEEGKNGFSFAPGSSEAIADVLQKIADCTDAQLGEMGKFSAEKASAITPAKWAETLFGLIHSR